MSSPTPLKFLMPGYFSVVMGLSGLTLAWHNAAGVLGEMADGIALVLGLLSAIVFGVLLVASWLRWQRYPAALADDLKHPVRHAFIAALPVSLLLLATVGVALGGAAEPLGPVWNALWWVGSLGQLWATVWVLGRWLAPAAAAQPGAGGAAALWPTITPVLLIPVVGNVVVPLAGLPLGHEWWSSLQFGIGAFLWPVVIALILVRRIAHSPLPDRILPAWFITIAPPAVIGLAQPLSSEEVERYAITIFPDGRNLPPGRGSVAQGAQLYARHCAACHGAQGVEGPASRLVGSDGFIAWNDLLRPLRVRQYPLQVLSVGAMWPYATTVFDYVRRAMPHHAPKSLTDDEVYAITAHLLHLNGLVGADAVMDRTSLPKVVMPGLARTVSAWPPGP